MRSVGTGLFFFLCLISCFKGNHSSEGALLSLRNLANPYTLCLQLLQCDAALVQFHAASTIKVLFSPSFCFFPFLFFLPGSMKERCSGSFHSRKKRLATRHARSITKRHFAIDAAEIPHPSTLRAKTALACRGTG